MKKEKIGIIGFGAIGQEVYKKISKKIIKGYSVVGVFSNDIQDKKLSKKIKCTSFEELLKKRPDIIIEAASVDACKDYLEKSLNSQIINSAVGGWDSFQIIQNVLKNYKFVKPNLVIIQFTDAIERSKYKVYSSANKSRYDIIDNSLSLKNYPVKKFIKIT